MGHEKHTEMIDLEAVRLAREAGRRGSFGRWAIPLILSSLVSLGPIHAGPSIPEDAKRCMSERKLWLAAPRFVEALDFDLGGGRREKAYQIHDQLAGADGHILVFPARCRVVVLVVQPPGQPRGELERQAFISAPPGAPATDRERQTLERWAGLRPITMTDPAVAAARVWDGPSWSSAESVGSGIERRVLQQAPRWYQGPPPTPRRVKKDTERPGLFRILYLDAIEDTKTGPVPIGEPSGHSVRLLSVGRTPTRLGVMLEDREQSRFAWVGIFDLPPTSLETYRVGRWLWFVGAPDGRKARVHAVDVSSGAMFVLEIDVGSGNIRATLGEAGLSVGTFSEPGREIPWKALSGLLP